MRFINFLVQRILRGIQGYFLGFINAVLESYDTSLLRKSMGNKST